MITKFLLLCAVALSRAIEIHHHMTDKEIQTIFRVPRHAVPDYEVVPVLHTLHKRSANDEQVVKMRAFDRNIRLYLRPTEGILFGMNTPVYSVAPDVTQPRGLKYRKLRDAHRGIGKAYQDMLTNTALVIIKKDIDKSVQMVGKVLNDLFIEPLPSRLKELFRGRRSVNETDDNFEQTHHHIIFKRHDPSHDEVQQGIKLVKRERTHLENSRTIRSIRRIPDVIYPEVLVIMDYNLYKTQDKDFKKAMVYLLAFWNAVDLRYRRMSKPRVRLHIAGLIIATKKGGTPYIDKHRRGVNQLDADGALIHMSKYFYEEKRLPFSKYDLAVAMTPLDACNMDGTDYCDTATLGYAYEAGACNRSAIDRNTEAVGLVEDNGGYSAIIPAAHEVAHLLGVPHDGTEDARDCPGYDGFIMSAALNLGENNFHWSNCSIEIFRQFIISPDSTCLINQPELDIPVPKALPGKILTLDAQCQKLNGTRACKFDASVCTRLSCHYENSAICKVKTAAAEGSACGNHMHCLNGQCLPVSATELAELPKFRKKQFYPKIPKFNPSYWTSPFISPNKTMIEK